MLSKIFFIVSVVPKLEDDLTAESHVLTAALSHPSKPYAIAIKYPLKTFKKVVTLKMP